MDIGGKIRKLRIANDLTLEELASRSELTKGFLSQVERNLTSPSISTLEDILEALGTSLAEFFREEKEDQIVFGEEDFFIDEKDGSVTEWIIPNAQKNDMEPIRLTLQPGGSSAQILNHQGQEFGYVLKGTVILELEDGRKVKAKAGQTFYLDGSLSHHITNPAKSPAQVLWISSPPIF